MIYAASGAVLQAKDVRFSASFYEKLSGKKAVFLPPDSKEPKEAYVPFGLGFVRLVEKQGKCALGSCGVVLLVDDMYATLEALRQAGISCGQPQMGLGGSIRAGIRDNEGRPVELLQIIPGSVEASLWLSTSAKRT